MHGCRGGKVSMKSSTLRILMVLLRRQEAEIKEINGVQY